MMEDYLRLLAARGQAAGTLAWKRIYLRQFVSFLTRFGVQDMKDVTSAQVEEYHCHLLHGGSSRALKFKTIQTHLFLIRQFFREMAARGRMLGDPTAGLGIPRGVVGLPKALPSAEQVAQILRRPDDRTPEGLRDRAILEVLYSTGIRRQELINLDLRDLDMSGGLLRVTQGKNRKDRVVPVGREAVAAVRRYVEFARPRYLERARRRPRRYEPALFLMIGGRRISGAFVRGMIRRVVDEMNLGVRVTAHTFRHCCATHMLAGGADIRTIQALLGHESIETTQLYTRVCPVDLMAAHRRYHPDG